jgi:UDP-N-acetylmuramoylalanine--D-glutamate ligase
MKVAILGYDVDGRSSADYWHKKGAEITVCDQKTDIQVPDFASSKLGPDYLKNLDEFDVLVRTPGLHPSQITKANADNPDILKKVTTSINEFFEHCQVPIIAVTGTKGKGTTCTLIYKILQAGGKKAYLGGNIGQNPLDFLNEITNDAWVVLELSNFQMIDFKYSPKIGVCLMIAPEHQDWHNNVGEYFSAKENLFARQTKNDLLVYNANNEITLRVIEPSQAEKIPYFVPEEDEEPGVKNGSYVVKDTIFMVDKPVCKTSDVALLGRHNLENVCAAIATTWKLINGNQELITKVLQDFKGMEHRLELVREVGGVKYYNDSFATTPEATLAAIKSFKEPKVLILGGHDKGASFYELANEITNSSSIRQVIAIGETGEKFIDLLNDRGFDKITLGGNTMQSIVNAAKNTAQPGDVVLLSTACASFGLFKNYKDRGNQFKDVVNSL